MRGAILLIVVLAGSTAAAEPAVTIADALRAEADLSAAIAAHRADAIGTALTKAARIPWPLLTPATDALLAQHLKDLEPASRRRWALDRALPILAGEISTTDDLTRAVLDEVSAATDVQRTRATDMLRIDEARRAYATRQLPQAAERYSRVTQGSPLWPDALRERAWTLLLLDRPSDSLGATVALGAPYFPQEDHAEGRLLRATVLLGRCRYDEVRAIIAPLADATLPALDDTAFASVKAPADAATARAWASPLVARVRQAIATTGGLTDQVTLTRKEALVRLGQKLFHDAFVIEAEQLRQIKTRALAVRYESFRQQRQILERGQNLSTPTLPVPESLGDDDVAWTFDGTYWRDELGSYRYAAGDACPHDRVHP